MRQLPSVGDMRRAVITSAATTFVMGGEHSSRSFAAINWPPLLTPSLVQRLTANAMIAGRWSQSVAMGRSQAVWVWQSRARSCDPPCYNRLPSDAEWSICSCQPLCPTMHAGWCHVSLTKDEALRWGSRLSSSLAATTTMTAGRQAVTSLISHVTDGDWTRGEGGQLCLVSGHVAWTDLFKITMGCMIMTIWRTRRCVMIDEQRRAKCSWSRLQSARITLMFVHLSFMLSSNLGVDLPQAHDATTRGLFFIL